MEFKKYKQLGAYHWDEYKRKTIYGNHADKIKNWVNENGKTLDIGAGDGLITSLIPNTIGIDNNEIAVYLAKQKNVDVRLGSAYDLNFSNNEFNNVLMCDVIEHLEFPDESINEIKRVLKNNGYLYITTPPANENGKLHDKYHYKEYTPKELQNYIESFGFKLINKPEIKFVRIYEKFKLL